jgi:hypothetical protein
VQTGPWDYPASYTKGTGTFPGVKRPKRGAAHIPYSAEVKKEKSSTSPLWAYVAFSRVEFPFTFIKISYLDVISLLPNE